MDASPRYYGVIYHPEYSVVEHAQADRVFHPVAQANIAEEQMNWMIAKGDAILSEGPIIVTADVAVSFKRADHRVGKIVIYSYDDDDPPARVQGARSGTLTFGYEVRLRYLTFI